SPSRPVPSPWAPKLTTTAYAGSTSTPSTTATPQPWPKAHWTCKTTSWPPCAEQALTRTPSTTLTATTQGGPPHDCRHLWPADRTGCAGRLHDRGGLPHDQRHHRRQPRHRRRPPNVFIHRHPGHPRRHPGRGLLL